MIVVDELDRCRPDYALSLLEVIKHFFAVDHVHFVLGVNLRELENMVRVRYDTLDGAALYLQKFVTLTMDLPRLTNDPSERLLAISAFKVWAEASGFHHEVIETYEICLIALARTETITLRGVRRILAIMKLLPPKAVSHDQLFGSYQFLIAILAILKATAPKVFETIEEGTIDGGRLIEMFAVDGPFDDIPRGDHLVRKTIDVFFLGDSFGSDWHGFGPRGDIRDAQRAVQQTIRNYLIFDLPEPNIE